MALTLREVCGLTTEEIARAFLVAPSTLAQRIVRAKAVIRDKAVPYQVPATQELPARLGAVLQVVYLVFNEGYSAGATGAELSREAIRLGRLLTGLLPEPEAMGLLGLMLLQESRRAARISAEGDLILLDQQDRSLWNREQIVEGISLHRKRSCDRTVSVLIPCRRPLQPFMPRLPRRHPLTGARSHCSTTSCFGFIRRRLWSSTAQLLSPCARGRSRVSALIDGLLAGEELASYHLAHSARADLCRRLGRLAEARDSYEKALALVRYEPERRFLAGRLRELQ